MIFRYGDGARGSTPPRRSGLCQFLRLLPQLIWDAAVMGRTWPPSPARPPGSTASSASFFRRGTGPYSLVPPEKRSASVLLDRVYRHDLGVEHAGLLPRMGPPVALYRQGLHLGPAHSVAPRHIFPLLCPMEIGPIVNLLEALYTVVLFRCPHSDRGEELRRQPRSHQPPHRDGIGRAPDGLQARGTQPGHRLPQTAGRKPAHPAPTGSRCWSTGSPGAGRSQHYVVDLTYSQLGAPCGPRPPAAAR